MQGLLVRLVRLLFLIFLLPSILPSPLRREPASISEERGRLESVLAPSGAPLKPVLDTSWGPIRIEPEGRPLPI